MKDCSFAPFSLEDKRVLVTGASSGIGKAVAIACSRMGAQLFITGRNVERLEATKAALFGSGHEMLPADLAKQPGINSVAGQLPPLDGIVYCAGIGQRKPCKMLTSGDVDEVMDINFKSNVLLQAELLRGKKLKEASSVVFIASKAATSPSVGNAVYSASKGAVISYAKCLALELAPRRIRVNCICPAMVWTSLIFQGGLTKEDMEERQLQYPLKRYGEAEDVAYLAIYLLSGASAWMTGSCLEITGGGE